MRLMGVIIAGALILAGCQQPRPGNQSSTNSYNPPDEMHYADTAAIDAVVSAAAENTGASSLNVAGLPPYDAQGNGSHPAYNFSDPGGEMPPAESYARVEPAPRYAPPPPAAPAPMPARPAPRRSPPSGSGYDSGPSDTEMAIGGAVIIGTLCYMLGLCGSGSRQSAPPARAQRGSDDGRERYDQCVARCQSIQHPEDYSAEAAMIDQCRRGC